MSSHGSQYKQVHCGCKGVTPVTVVQCVAETETCLSGNLPLKFQRTAESYICNPVADVDYPIPVWVYDSSCVRETCVIQKLSHKRLTSISYKTLFNEEKANAGCAIVSGVCNITVTMTRT